MNNNNDVTKYWDMRGETYSKSWQSLAKKRLSKMETGVVVDALKSTIKNRKGKQTKVLDVGVAIGRIAKEILKHDCALYGTDISEIMVKICQNKFSQNKRAKKFVVHNMENPLPKDLGTFDVVSAIRVLSYSSRLKLQLKNIYRSMNSGGSLVFTVPNKNSSAILPKYINNKSKLGFQVDHKELKQIIKDVGFTEHRIVGFSRLLDTFYDVSDTKLSANLLFSIESILGKIFGPTLFVRLFYVTCVK